MKLLKFPFFFALALSMLFTACDKNSADDDILVNNNVVMSGNQETPPNTSTATGKVQANYNKRTKLLSYTITWSGLSAVVTGMHIHAVTEPGVAAPVVQNFSGYPTTVSGTYSGTLTTDDVFLKESELLTGKFYFNIHNSVYPNGEIRGQLTFPQ